MAVKPMHCEDSGVTEETEGAIAFYVNSVKISHKDENGNWFSVCKDETLDAFFGSQLGNLKKSGVKSDFDCP